MYTTFKGGLISCLGSISSCDGFACQPNMPAASVCIHTVKPERMNMRCTTDLCLLIQVVDLTHVVSVLLLAFCYLTLQLGGVVLVSLQMLQAQPELLDFSSLFCSQLAHLLQSLHLEGLSTTTAHVNSALFPACSLHSSCRIHK